MGGTEDFLDGGAGLHGGGGSDWGRGGPPPMLGNPELQPQNEAASKTASPTEAI